MIAAREQAQSYFESQEPRKAVATLAEAATKHPKDRTTAGMLFAGIRDHVWHLPQILPIKHRGAVKAVAFSPDGKWVATGSVEGDLFVSTTDPLDQEDADAQRIKIPRDGEVFGLLFSSDNKLLAVAGKAGPVEVWEVAKPPKKVFTGAAPGGSVTAFAADPNGHLLAIAAVGGAIQVINIEGGKVAKQWTSPGGEVRALAFSNGGKKLAAAGGDKSARVWDAESGELLGPAIAHQGAVLTVDFSVDDRYLVTGGEDKIAKLSDIAEGVPVMPEMKCGAAVQKIIVSPGGSSIATILDDWSISFWDALTGKKLPFNLREDAAFNDFVWSRTGLRGATASDAGHAALWTMRNGTRRGELMPHDAPVVALALTNDSKLLAAGSNDGVARVWRTDGGAPLSTVRTHLARARSAFYSQNGEHLVTTSEDHTALHWESGKVTPSGPALVHKGKVTCGVFNKEATRILTCDTSGVAQLWETAAGKADGAPYTHPGPVNWVDYHPDDKRVVTASGASARVWSVANRKKPLATITHEGKAKSEIKCARFSPDGKWLVTASTDGTAQVWDAATYKSTGVKIDRQFPVLCVRFSPDGSRLVVAGEDGQAAVFDTANWKPVGVPVLAPGPVFSAAITDDNQFIVISSLLLDSVQYYEISTGRALGQGLVIPTQATCVDYHVQDRVVIVACDDGTVRALGVPFVNEDVPGWVAGFAERVVGLRKTGPEAFERVDAHLEQLRAYAPRDAVGANRDFPKLVQWKMTMGTERHGFPRFTSTVGANIEQRVEERSVDALFECYEAVSGNPLILSSLSLFLPNRRQGEFIADLVLKMPDVDSLSRCYAAGTLIQCGRSQEALAVVAKALADAPNDARVVRRAAKIAARLQEREKAIELFEKALTLEPDNSEAMRSYAWALYNFGQAEKAAKQFRAAQVLVGNMDDDLVAGICLCAAARKKDGEAREVYKQLVAIDPAWRDPAHLAGLRGWMQGELAVLERVRRTVFPGK